MRSLLTQIPPDASVAATTYIVPHLSSRRAIIRWPALQIRNDAKKVVQVDYAIADLWQLQQYQVAFKQDRQLLQDSVATIERLFHNGEYGIIAFQDGVILMQKGVTSIPEATAAWLASRQQLTPVLNQLTSSKA
jgi:hypothetical protein